MQWISVGSRVYTEEVDFLEQRLSFSIIPVTSDHLSGDIFFRQRKLHF